MTDLIHRRGICVQAVTIVRNLVAVYETESWKARQLVLQNEFPLILNNVMIVHLSIRLECEEIGNVHINKI